MSKGVKSQNKMNDLHLLKKKNFSLFMIDNSNIDITKNEHGTWGEFNDYVISVKIDNKTNKVISWSVKISDEENNEQLMSEIMVAFADVQTFTDLCNILIEKF